MRKLLVLVFAAMFLMTTAVPVFAKDPISGAVEKGVDKVIPKKKTKKVETKASKPNTAFGVKKDNKPVTSGAKNTINKKIEADKNKGIDNGKK
jgi:hypothetical protein